MPFESFPTTPVQENSDRTIEGGHVENVAAYEREKIETTLRDAEHLVAVMKNYLATVDYADENGIELVHKPDLSSIRTPGAMFEPSSENSLARMSTVFQNAMSEVARDIHIDNRSELESRYVTRNNQYDASDAEIEQAS